MAKNQTKATYQHVSKNTKTPAQKAKAEANKLAHAERTRDMQAKQKQAAQYRKLGFTGLTDDIVIQKYRQHMEAVAQQEQAAADVAFIQFACYQCGKASGHLKAFLSERINREPSFVMQKINDFFSRPRNKTSTEFIRAAWDNINKPKTEELKEAA